MLHIHSQCSLCHILLPLHGTDPHISNCKFAALQVTEHLAAQSAQFREAAVHYRLGLMAKAIHAWYTWLGRHLSNATARQERLLNAQVSIFIRRKAVEHEAATDSTAHRGAQESLNSSLLAVLLN